MRRMIAITLLAATVSTVALAHPAGRNARHHRRPGHEAVAARLNLSDAQRAQVRAIREDQRDATRELRQELRRMRRELRQMREPNSPEAERLEARMEELRDRLQGRVAAARTEFRKVLTAEQRAELDRLREQRRERAKR